MLTACFAVSIHNGVIKGDGLNKFLFELFELFELAEPFLDNKADIVYTT